MALPMEPLWGEGYRESCACHSITLTQRDREGEGREKERVKELPLLRSIKAMSVGDDGDGECVYLFSIEITGKLLCCCLCTLGMHYALFSWIGYKSVSFFGKNKVLLSRKYSLLWEFFQFIICTLEKSLYLLVFKVANHKSNGVWSWYTALYTLWYTSYIGFCISGFCPLGVQVRPGF